MKSISTELTVIVTEDPCIPVDELFFIRTSIICFMGRKVLEKFMDKARSDEISTSAYEDQIILHED